MGMYDNVTCDYPLPDQFECLDDFQSKQFGCALSRIKISSDGKLSINGTEVEFHGWFHFYDSDIHGDFIQYFAKFTDGKIEKMIKEPPLPWECFGER